MSRWRKFLHPRIPTSRRGSGTATGRPSRPPSRPTSARSSRAARGAGLAPQEAEDVTQATFTTFIESAPRFEGRSSVRTWLFGILYKKIAEARRAGQRDRQHEEIDEAFEGRFDARGQWSTPPRPVDTVLHQKAVETEIFNCLDAAPLRQSLAFILREVEELPTEDICNVLGITRTNFGVMIHRIRNRVRDCLWVDYPDKRFPATDGRRLAATRRSGGAVPAMDLLIGTTAVLADAVLVTRNRRDFERIPGLTVRAD